MNSHALSEGLKNIFRSFWLSVTAITVLTVSMGTVVLVASISSVSGYLLSQLDDGVSVVAFLSDTVTEDQANELTDEISSKSFVERVEYRSAEQEQQLFAENQANVGGIVDYLNDKTDSQVLQASLSIYPVETEDFNQIEELLNTEDYDVFFSSVLLDRDFYENVVEFNRFFNIFGFLVILIFAVISVLVMVNILRIAIYNRKTEIEIMRLVGATNKYIRSPFIAEGVFYNLFASIIVLLIFVPSMIVLVPLIGSSLGSSLSVTDSGLTLNLALSVGVTIVMAIGVGAVASYFATQKYLKL